jgi:pyrroline-5-carboxylate reductase
MNLLFVGGGNMATALIGGLLESKSPLQRLHVIDPNPAAQEKLLSRFSADIRANGVDFSIDTRTCPASFSGDAANTWVVLAVKPQHMKDAVEQASPELKRLLQESLLLSIAAGVSIDSIGRWCGNPRVVRAMPNTPALISLGITGLFAAPAVSASARAQAEQLMNAVGKSIWIEREDLMDAVTALSGSGPAYVFRFVEALTAAGEQLGLSSTQSALLATETLKGAMALLESSGESPAVLREKVTSKGGTTAAALASLDRDQFMAAIGRALVAARDRGAEMSREFK